jgi:hypothetical protein
LYARALQLAVTGMQALSQGDDGDLGALNALASKLIGELMVLSECVRRQHS